MSSVPIRASVVAILSTLAFALWEVASPSFVLSSSFPVRSSALLFVSASTFVVAYLMCRREQRSRSQLVMELAANQRLQQEIQLQSTALGVAANAIAITDSTGAIVWVNDAFSEMTGYPSTELMGKNPRILKSGQHDDLFYWHLWKTISSGRVWRGEITNRRKDGTLKAADTVITPVRINGREITHYVSIKVDTTDRRESQRARMLSESALSSMVENAPYGIYWAALDGRIVHANPAMCRIVGCDSLDELKRITVQDLYCNPSDRDPLVRWLNTKGTVRDFSVQWKRKDGAVRSIQINGHIREEQDDGQLLYECYVEDVTERELAAKELQTLNHALSTLSECNEALTHATDEFDLLNRVCSIAVNTGGYRFAWVGFAMRDEHKHVMPVASAGFDEDYLRNSRFSWAEEDEFGRGPVGTAIRSGVVSVFHDIETDPHFLAWRRSALARKYASVVSLPLRQKTKTIGALTIYSSEPGAFNPAEIHLLEKLADDLSYGIASLTNMREKQLAEETLRSSEERYRFLFTLNPHPMWIFDLEGKNIREVNKAALTKYGYSLEEFLSLRLEDLHPAEEIPKLHEHLARAATDTLVKANTKHRRKDGSIIDVELAACNFTQEGRLLALVSSLDVTERVRAEKALRASEESYRTLYEHNHAAVFHSSNGRLIDCNDAMCRMFGYSREELESLDLTQLYANLDRREEGQRILENEGKISNFQIELLRKDGKVLNVLANLNILRQPLSEDLVIAGVLLDITEIRELETQLLQSQKLEAVGQLTGGIAHDFNNLLMIINSYSEILLSRMLPTEPLRRSVEQIQNAGERAASLTRQLLAFSRKQLMAPEALKLDTLVGGLSQMLQPLIGEDIDLRISPADELWTVQADPSQIEQVILNLTVNARDAMPNGGRLEISTVNIELDDEFVSANRGSKRGEYVALCVADSGTGMSSEVQAKIFEPFFTTKQPGRGTGLGLSTVYGIIKQSGGYITVSSVVGQGTTFTVYLPRSKNIPEKTLGVSTTKQFKSRSILVVEDEEATREAIREYLHEYGFCVSVASDAKDALAICDSSTAASFDVLLTDIVMPGGMNGAELASKIRALNPDITVIFMSGYTDDVLESKGVLGHSAIALAKPFRLPQLLEALRLIESRNAKSKSIDGFA
jgi:two-component system, cell cycle sensor histidine kinase and response regulator CckA